MARRGFLIGQLALPRVSFCVPDPEVLVPCLASGTCTAIGMDMRRFNAVADPASAGILAVPIMPYRFALLARLLTQVWGMRFLGEVAIAGVGLCRHLWFRA